MWQLMAVFAVAIVNGTPTADYPAVVAVLYDGVPRCTGTLITKRVVITAGHCIVAVDSMSIYIGDGAGPGIEIGVADARRHPGFDPEDLANDIAVLLLDDEAPITPIPLIAGLWDESFLGRMVTIVGFGATGPADEAGLKRTGTARLTSFDRTSLTFTPEPSQTCSGDSGGPAFLEIDGADVLVGVTSFGDVRCSRFGTNTRADRYVSSFVGPYIAAQTRGGRAVGTLCRSNDQCIEGDCRAVSDDLVEYCTRPCDRDDQCPGTMACMENAYCGFSSGGPAGLGAGCTNDDDCGSGICATLTPGATSQCAAWCTPQLERNTCGTDEVCVENLRVEDAYVCGPVDSIRVGCSSSSPSSGALLVVALALRRRRRAQRVRVVALGG